MPSMVLSKTHPHRLLQDQSVHSPGCGDCQWWVLQSCAPLCRLLPTERMHFTQHRVRWPLMRSVKAQLSLSNLGHTIAPSSSKCFQWFGWGPCWDTATYHQPWPNLASFNQNKWASWNTHQSGSHEPIWPQGLLHRKSIQDSCHCFATEVWNWST